MAGERWCHSRLDFAELARTRQRSSVIYVGPRRSLTGLNADQWIDCRPAVRWQSCACWPSNASRCVAQETGVTAVSSMHSGRVRSSKPTWCGWRRRSDGLEWRWPQRVESIAGQCRRDHQTERRLPRTRQNGSPAELRALADRMNAGSVSLLMVRGANPAFTLPKSTGFAAAMAKVPFKVSFSSYPDETSELADLVLPDDHTLEQWGDAEPIRGTISLQQPTMDRVFDTRATSDVLIAVGKSDPGSAARYAMPDYRSWLISRFPGGGAGSPPRCRAESPPASGGVDPLDMFPLSGSGTLAHRAATCIWCLLAPIDCRGRGANKHGQEIPIRSRGLLATVAEMIRRCGAVGLARITHDLNIGRQSDAPSTSVSGDAARHGRIATGADTRSRPLRESLINPMDISRRRESGWRIAFVSRANVPRRRTRKSSPPKVGATTGRGIGRRSRSPI